MPHPHRLTNIIAHHTPTTTTASSANCTAVLGGCQACINTGKAADDGGGGCVWCPQGGGCVSAYACLSPAGTCAPLCVHMSIHASIHSFAHSFIHSSFIYQFIYSSTHPAGPVNYTYVVAIWLCLSALICLCCLTCTTRRYVFLNFSDPSIPSPPNT